MPHAPGCQRHDPELHGRATGYEQRSARHLQKVAGGQRQAHAEHDHTEQWNDGEAQWRQILGPRQRHGGPEDRPDGKENHYTISRKGVYRHGTVILSLSEASACRYHTQTTADASLCSA